MKRWVIASSQVASFQVIEQLLYNRGVRDEEQRARFLHPDYSRDLLDPFLFFEMTKVCDLILQAVEDKEKIVIHGDYDSDGVGASVLLFETLKRLGADAVDIYLPHRDKEGYGLNVKTVELFIREQQNLVITVDCGSTNVAEITRLQAAGIKTIILDHHQEGAERPPYAAVLNPHFHTETYPFKSLCSVGVVFKLVQALRRLKPELVTESFEKWSLDLVAIATVTDCMELVGENRVLVTYGLKILHHTRRLGLQALLAAARLRPEKIGVYEIGFIIGPRLNAAGRVDHANSAVALLLAADPVTAQRLALELNITNNQRQAMTEELMLLAKQEIDQWPELPRVIVVHQPLHEPLGSWPVGLVGLVAGRIMQLYHRPSFVIGSSPQKGYLGSGRSFEGFDLMAALRAECSDLFTNFGGHAQACGVTFKRPEDIAVFTERLNQAAASQLTDESLEPVLKIDLGLNFDDITPALVDELNLLEPYGLGNPRPIFSSSGVTIEHISSVGQSGQHLRLSLGHNHHTHQVIGFRFGDWLRRVKEGDKVDVAYEIGWNEWNGSKTIQLKLVDIKKSV